MRRVGMLPVAVAAALAAWALFALAPRASEPTPDGTSTAGDAPGPRPQPAEAPAVAALAASKAAGEVRLVPSPRSPFHKGRVVSKDGRPVSGAWVWYHDGRHTQSTDDEGMFIVGWVPGFPHSVQAARNAFLPKTTVSLTATGFAEPVEIDMGIDAGIRVLARRGWREPPTILPSAAEGLARNGDIRVRLLPEVGAFVVEGVLPGHAYDVWSPPGEGEEFVLERGVRLGREPVDVRTRTSKAVVAGRVVLPRGARDIRVWVELRRGLASMHGKADAAGAFRIGPVPEGEWPVRASATDDAKASWTWSGTLSTAGENVVVLHR